MIQLVPFDDALASSDDPTKRTVLLGNGFSVACRPDIFRYDAIFGLFLAKVPPLDAQRVRSVFDAFETRDFEEVLRSLLRFAAIGPHYGFPPNATGALRQDASLIRDGLVGALAGHHPNGPQDVDDSEFLACATFLKNFASIYTLNYDLLLYWTVLNQSLDGHFRDGFGEPEGGAAQYVEWELGSETNANIHYLHGALHLFAAGSRVRKLSWRRTGKPLKDQILDQINAGRFPLFVAEGTAEGKKTTITRNGYLSRSYRSFQSKSGDLFVFGCSLGSSDQHIADAIGRGKWRRLFVGIYGDPGSAANTALLASCETLRETISARGGLRQRKSTREITYFDAASAQVWGTSTQGSPP